MRKAILIILLVLISTMTAYAEEETVYVKNLDDVPAVDAEKVKTEIGTYYKFTTDSKEAHEIAEEIPSAKLEGKFKFKGYTNDPYNNPSNSAQLYNNGVVDLYKNGIMGDGIEIAVLDTDVTSNLSELKNLDWDNAWDATKEKKLKRDGVADDEHATGVIGTIVGAPNNKKGVCGVAPNATVLPIRIGTDEDIEMEDVYNALVYLDKKLDEGKLPKLRIVNMSFGMVDEELYDNQDVTVYFDKYLYAKEIYSKICHIHDRHGITFVAAAGNEGDTGCIYRDDGIVLDEDFLGDNAEFPADCDKVISVGMTDNYSALSYLSNCRKDTDLFAVGEDVAVLYSDGSVCKGAEGTSYSSPIVAGIMALLLSENPSLTEKKMVSALKSTGTAMKIDSSTNERRKKDTQNKTVVNATRAYNKLFNKNIKIDTKYAFKSPVNTIQDNESCFTLKKSNFLSNYWLSEVSIYGLDFSDMPKSTFKKTTSKGYTNYKVTVKGEDLVTRSYTYKVPITRKPTVSIKKAGNKVAVKYKKKAKSDGLKIQITQNGSIYKTVYVESKKVSGKKTIMLPSGKYKVSVEPYFHYFAYEVFGTPYYWNYYVGVIKKATLSIS